jgi:predicted lipoprotein with Yx(FWY)xxD motif
VTGSLTTFARPDGTTQVAYNGSPLYYYAADTKAGDTTGQGVGGKWFIASPTGTGPGAAPSSSGRYGY